MDFLSSLAQYHETVGLVWFITAFPIFFILYFIMDAPFGRLQGSLSFFLLSPKLGFFLFEFPALIMLPVYYYYGRKDFANTVVLGLWLVHYINRAIVYPLLITTKKKNMGVATVIAGILFQCVNCYLLGMRFFGYTHHKEPLITNYNFSFWNGLGMFWVGFFINLHSDHILRELRRKSTGYVIPRGGFFEYVSCANYFGEIVEWCGFAIIANTFESYVFVLWVVANLLPRARSSHQFYLRTFGNKYPKNRKILFPYLW